jgi:dihydroflavonol-4-reductase
MLVAVTGSSGHVGANLVRALLAQGRKVRALIRPGDTRAVDGLPVELSYGDLLDQESLARTFKDAEVVYHLAARISISSGDAPEVFRVNVDGTRNVVEACLRSGVRRLIHFSSVHAFEQAPHDRPIDEERPIADTDRTLPYDRSKARGEREVMAGVQRGLDAVILNPSGIIGPHDFKPSPLGEILLKLAQRRLPGLVAAGYDWVDVRDVVEAALRAEERGKTGEKFLVTGHWAPIRRLAEIVHSITGARPPRLIAPLWLAKFGAPFSEGYAKLTGKRPQFTSHSMAILSGNSRFLSEKAQRHLDHKPRPLEETIRDALSWYKANGYL